LVKTVLIRAFSQSRGWCILRRLWSTVRWARR